MRTAAINTTSKVVIPPIAHLSGRCMAGDYQRKNCPFFIDRSKDPRSGFTTCGWNPLSNQEPLCEGKNPNCPRAKKKVYEESL